MKHSDTAMYRGKILRTCVFCTLVFTSTIMAQTYQELQDFGWGIGLNRPSQVIADLDGNGRLDMLVATEAGGIMRFEQSAAGGREFRILDRRFMTLSNNGEAALGIADIDGDGRLDLITGRNGGGLGHYEQSDVNSATFVLVSEKFSDIDPPTSSKPCFTDLDGDGLLDLILGSAGSEIRRYTQDAPASEHFTRARDLRFSPANSYLYQAAFADLDNDGALDLVMGNWDGDVSHFEAHEAVKDSFILVEQRWSGIPERTMGCPFFIDIDGNGLLDCLIGYGAGGMEHREQAAQYSTDFSTLRQEDVLNIWDFGQESIVGIADLDEDGRLDILRCAAPMGESIMLRYPIFHFTQTAVGDPRVSTVTSAFSGILSRTLSAISIADLDGDGTLDLFLSRTNRDSLALYRQRAAEPFMFDRAAEPFLQGQLTNNGEIPPMSFTDLDGDGLLDLLLVCGGLHHFEQSAAGAASFVLVKERIIPNFTSGFTLADLDGDGLIELLTCVADAIRLYRQDGPHSAAFVKITDAYGGIHAPGGVFPIVADVNADSRQDIIVADEYGGLSLFLDAGPVSVRQPDAIPERPRLLDVSPHPFSTRAALRVAMPSEAPATVRLYDMLGRDVSTVADSRMLAQGANLLEIDARGLRPGGYLIVLEAAGTLASMPVMIMR